MEEEIKSCHVACMANLADVTACTSFCKTCVQDDACFSNATTYKDAADMTCFKECRKKCVETLGSEASFCDCDQHKACLFGCPQNCTGLDPQKKRCLTNCTTTTGDPEACDTLCTKCLEELTCWTSGEYASKADFDCFNECYIDCENVFGEDAWECDCD
jgi:hypothetical protein